MNETLIKMIVFSDPGVGKTVLFSTALDVPQMNPVLLLDMEGNTASIKSKCIEITKDQLNSPIEGKINCLRIKSPEEMHEVKDKLLDMGDKLPWRTIGLDSLTEMDYKSLQGVVKEQNIKRAFPGVPGMPDYGVNLIRIKNLVYAFRNMPCHVIATCHSYYDEQRELITPSLNGQLRQAVPGIFLLTGVITLRNEKRVLDFESFGKYYAKSCTESQILKNRIQNPTMQIIYEALNS